VATELQRDPTTPRWWLVAGDGGSGKVTPGAGTKMLLWGESMRTQHVLHGTGRIGGVGPSHHPSLHCLGYIHKIHTTTLYAHTLARTYTCYNKRLETLLPLLDAEVSCNRKCGSYEG
jgi:hypothetical protein